MAEKYSITKKEEVYNLLKNKRNFEYMSESLLRQLIDVMKVVRFRKERILIKQGAENAFCYIIIRGSVSVYVDGKFLYKLRRTGDVFGEISFVTQSISTATIKAEKDLGVMVISYSFFNKLKNIELALWIARVIGEKLVRTSKIKSEGAAPAVNEPVIPVEAPLSEADSTEIVDETASEEDENITEPETEASEQIEPADSAVEPTSDPETNVEESPDYLEIGSSSKQSEEDESIESETEEIPAEEPSDDQNTALVDNGEVEIGPASEEVIDLDLDPE
ncbi:MAG: cyclic nucleotide-binding domain-containing protein [Proteobacteria bacterium]|nr:cyclic nucleotide-binding domain-containing protein [Pseudomonadota bacterium]